MKDIEFRNMHWDHSWTEEGVQEDIEFQVGKIANEMTKLYSNSCIIVVIKNCDIHGTYDSMDIHVFANFLNANHMINSEVYEHHHAIDIYQYDCIKDQFTIVMNKCHDSYRFDRLASVDNQKMFDDQLRFRMRRLFDMKSTNVTLHPYDL